MVVGRLDAVVIGERPERRPDLEQVARQAAGVLVARRLAAVGAQDRLEFAAQRADAPLELWAIAGVLVDLPRPEELLADPQAVLGELLFDAKAVGVGLEVSAQMRLIPMSG
jgi:hypothetical protein